MHKSVRPVTQNEQAWEPSVRRIEQDIVLECPSGHYASVLLRRVQSTEGDHYYTWWALVGRQGTGTSNTLYTHTAGAQTIRFDLPEGMPLSAESLQPHLEAFLIESGSELEAAEPPIIRP